MQHPTNEAKSLTNVVTRATAIAPSIAKGGVWHSDSWPKNTTKFASLRRCHSILWVLLALPTQGLWAHGAAQYEGAQGDASPSAADQRTINFPNTKNYQTLVVDLHTHTVFSDGHVWPKIRVEESLRDGLDAMAVTEHLEYQPHRYDIPHPDRNRAYEDTVESAKDQDLLIIPGTEITRDAPAGHMNAVFIEDANKMFNVPNPPEDGKDVGGYYAEASKWPAQNAVDAANEQGAFVFWNHPFWSRQSPDGIARINDFHANNAKRNKLHGIEVANGQFYSEEAHQIALDHDLALIGVSDIHDLIDWDYDVANGGHRPVTLVLAKTRTIDSIREALFARRTVIWFRNLLIGRKAEIADLLDASLEIVNTRYLPSSSVLIVDIKNHTDADFELRNTTKMSFVEHADRIVIPAHSTFSLGIKPGKQLKKIELDFVVENALIAPKKHPNIQLKHTIEVAEAS